MQPNRNWTEEESKPLLLVSQCLLGERVRYDGKHKRHDWLMRELAPWIRRHSICPEVSMGLGVPREPIQQEETFLNTPPELIGIQSRRNLTELARSTFRSLLDETQLPVPPSGALMKSGSPSCAPGDLAIFRPPVGAIALPPVHRNGTGMFTAALRKKFPWIPISDELRLETPEGREFFSIRLFTMSDFHHRAMRGESVKDFFSRHRLLLQTFSPEECQKLRKLSLTPDSDDAFRAALGDILIFMPDSAKRARALRQALSEVRDAVKSEKHPMVIRLIEEYEQGSLPWHVPCGMLRTLAERAGRSELSNQSLFEPTPPGLKFT